MHAYLLVGTNKKRTEENIFKISKKLKSEVMDFPLQKIEDARELSKFTKLKRTKKRILVLKNIDLATTESLNAFLKNLEEPQESISFILTANNLTNILPTISSRCVVVSVGNRGSSKKESEVSMKFLKLSVIEKFSFLESYKDRGQAIIFLEGLVFFIHDKLKLNPKQYLKVLLLVNTTLERIRKNANVNLQLTNMAIQISL